MAKNKIDTKHLNARIELIRDSLFTKYLPDPNEQIAKSAKGLKIFDDMLLDARINSLFFDRRNATQNLPLQIAETDDEKINAYSREYLSEKNLRKWSVYLLTGALKYGFRPAEIIWEKDESGLYFIDNLIGHDINRYKFDKDGNLLYLQYGQTVLLEEPYKWIVHAIEGDRYNNPYGEAYLKSVYWPWSFKKLGFQFWLTAAEKFAVPSIIALFEQSDPERAKKAATDIAVLISQINSGSSGALANVQNLQQLNMAGSVADFDTLIRSCDLQIAYGMTGQALATNISDTGTQALGTVQERTKQAAYENDARALAYTMQKLINMAIEVNFGLDAPAPEVSYDTGDYASFTNVMTAIDHGIPISKSAIYDRYGLPEPEGDDDIFTRPVNTVQTPFTGGYNPFDFSDNGKKKVLKRTMIHVMK